MQFANPANPAAHAATAAEVLADPGLPIDAFVAGVGTGGTITGCARVLREAAPGIRVVAVEPAESAVLSGGAPGPHGIQGIGAGFVPDVLQRGLITEVRRVATGRAAESCRQLAAAEGLFLGLSSGAATAAALDVAAELGPGRRVVAISPDRGDRYVSLGVWGGAAL
jgi:cysteine synthase A